MEDVIARMKAAKELRGNESRTIGVEKGKEWMMKECNPHQAEKLERIHRNEGFIFTDEGGGIEVLAKIILDDEDADIRDSDVTSYLAEQGIGEDEIEDQAFLDGFVEGALDIWGEIKNQI